MTRIVVTFNDNGTIGRNAYVPADKTDLRNYHSRLCTHLKDLIPHRENESLKYGTCHGVLLIKDLGLIYGEIRDLSGLLINGSRHAAVVEVINTVTVIAESAAGTCNVHLAVSLDGNKSYGINSIGINGTTTFLALVLRANSAASLAPHLTPG